MKMFDLPGKIVEVLTVYRKHPKTKRLTVSRYKLIRMDVLSKYALVESGLPRIKGEVVSETDRSEFFIEGKNSLKPIPKGALK